MKFLENIRKKIESNKEKKFILEEGRRIFRDHNLRPEESVFFIKEYHIGDIVRTLPVITLFKNYHKADQNKKFVTLTTENKVGLMSMNPDVDEAVVLSLEELSAIKQYRAVEKRRVCIYEDAYSPYEVFEPYNIPKEYAKKHRELWMIPKNFGANSIKAAEEFLSEMELNPLKTLLLIPFAGSSTSMELQHLIPVVNCYKKAGYRVLLNTYKSNETLEGTEPVSLPADVMLATIQKGFMVIGVQCGLMDVCEWMELTKRIIKVYLLKTKKDNYYFANRNGDKNKRIEKKAYGYTITVSTEEEMKRLSDDIIELSKKINPDLTRSKVSI